MTDEKTELETQKLQLEIKKLQSEFDQPRWFSRPPWNTLEASKIVLGGVFTGLVAVFVWWAGIQNTQNAEREKRQIEGRFKVWDQMAPSMNKIYCYFLYVGDWQGTSPAQVIQAKRELDRLVYSNKMFFSEPFVGSYESFMHAAFITHRGWKKEPMLRSVAARTLDTANGAQQAEFEGCDNGDQVFTAYWDYQAKSSAELDLPKASPAKRPDKPTGPAGVPCQR